MLAPVEADERTGAVESAFGGDFRNGEVGIFQQFFSSGKATILQIAERRSSAVVRKELTQQRHADSGMFRCRPDRDGTGEIFMQEFEGFAEFRVLLGGEGLFLLESREPLQKAQQQSRCPRKIVFLGHIAQFKKHADSPRFTAEVKGTPVLGKQDRIRLKNAEDVDTAATSFMREYEKCANQGTQQKLRTTAAEQIYNVMESYDSPVDVE